MSKHGSKQGGRFSGRRSSASPTRLCGHVRPADRRRREGVQAGVVLLFRDKAGLFQALVSEAHDERLQVVQQAAAANRTFAGN